jgi:hypothetical protein
MRLLLFQQNKAKDKIENRSRHTQLTLANPSIVERLRQKIKHHIYENIQLPHLSPISLRNGIYIFNQRSNSKSSFASTLHNTHFLCYDQNVVGENRQRACVAFLAIVPLVRL